MNEAELIKMLMQCVTALRRRARETIRRRVGVGNTSQVASLAPRIKTQSLQNSAGLVRNSCQRSDMVDVIPARLPGLRGTRVLANDFRDGLASGVDNPSVPYERRQYFFGVSPAKVNPGIDVVERRRS